jgi:hypothetical protein
MSIFNAAYEAFMVGGVVMFIMWLAVKNEGIK